ncbi:flavin prenyltransferase UbiX [Neisseriaceae bacterium B1]
MTKNIKQIRFENFETLINEAGSIAELARRTGYNKPAYLYQVHSQKVKPNGTALQIGRRMAAKLEEGMGKPAGWMDKKHSNMVSYAPKSAPKSTQAQTDNSGIQTITLALTGASGMPYAIRLLEVLLAAGKTVYLVYSQAAQIVAQQEMNFSLPTSSEEAQKSLCQHFGVSPEQLRVFGKQEWFAPIASGSAVADAMVICPASMGTVAAVAHGLSENLLHRAADVSIKERRPLIIVPREAPLSALHLENLLKLAQLGCTILPPAAGFYNHPQTLQDIIDFVVARILDQLHIPHTIMQKWGS